MLVKETSSLKESCNISVICTTKVKAASTGLLGENVKTITRNIEQEYNCDYD